MNFKNFKARASTRMNVSTSNDYVQLAYRTTDIAIINTTTSTAWVKFGDSASVSAAVPVLKQIEQDTIPIPAGGSLIIARPLKSGFMSAILQEGSGELLLVLGEGA